MDIPVRSTMTIRGGGAVMQVGDTFTMPITVRRKWWQLWKPREFTQLRVFTVTDTATGKGA